MNKIMGQELVARLRAIYGDDLLKITSYGSYARVNQTEESDIDIWIVEVLNFRDVWPMDKHQLRRLGMRKL